MKGQIKQFIKNLVRERLSENFQEIHDTKWDKVTDRLNPEDITSSYSSHDLIDFITHYDSEYFGYNLDGLITGLKNNPKLKHFKKLYIELLLKEKTGSLSNDEREQLSSYINNNNNDYPVSRETKTLAEARYDSSNISEDIGLFVLPGNTIVLYDMLEYDDSDRIRGIKGFITLSDEGWAYSAIKAAANKGYGPLIFELGMQHISPKGMVPDRDGDIREGAMSVLEKFVNGASSGVEVTTLMPDNERYVKCLDFGCDDNEPEFFKVYNSVLSMSDKSLYNRLKAEGDEFLNDVGSEFLIELRELVGNYWDIMYSQS